MPGQNRRPAIVRVGKMTVTFSDSPRSVVLECVRADEFDRIKIMVQAFRIARAIAALATSPQWQYGRNVLAEASINVGSTVMQPRPLTEDVLLYRIQADRKGLTPVRPVSLDVHRIKDCVLTNPVDVRNQN
jgi:hypothetical protein